MLLALAHGAPRAQDSQAPDPDPNSSDNNHPQEVIVWLKDDQPFAELQRKIQNHKSPADKDRAGADYRAQVKRLTESLLTRVAPQSAAVVKGYANLPVALITVTDPELLDRLRSAPEVQGIYPNQKHKLFLTESLPLINQHLAADLGAKGKNTAVAILDTGVNYAHPEFGACTAPGAPATCRVVYADDFTASDDGQLDADGHGTNVAGIAAGVAPETKIIALDVFNGEYANTSDILAAIDWVIQNQTSYNIVAVNMSLGISQLNTAQCTNSVFSGAFQRLRQAGAIPVVASGNDAYINGLAEPACAPGAVSVGAVYDAPFNYVGWQECTDYSPAAGQVTCFSNSAGFLTLLAPGSLITAAGLSMGGTSMAAPHVAGAVAVLRGEGGYPEAAVDDIVSHLVTSGRPVTDTRNNLTHPLLDLEAALYVGKPLPPPVITSVTPDSAGRGSTVTIEGSGFVRVSGVSFGGTPASSFWVSSTRKIVAVVGEGASGDVAVTTAKGAATMPGFVYLPQLIHITNIPASHRLTFINDRLQLRVEGTYADGTTRDVTQAATFYTSNTLVATVDAQGLVRPVDEGETTIYSNVNGFSAATSLEVNFIANKIYETEPNNTFETANRIVEDGKIHAGGLSHDMDVDLYEIDLPDPRLISILIRPAINSHFGEIRASILDANGTVLAAREIEAYRREFINLSVSAQKADKYYLKIDKLYSRFDGDYEFLLQLHDNSAGFTRREMEQNDTPAEANRFTLGTSIYGQLSSAVDKDYYAFDLSPGVLTVHVKATESRYGENRVAIVNETGAILVARNLSGYSTTYTTLTARINTAGAYYVVIMDGSDYYYFDQDYELLPQFSVDAALFGTRENEPNDTQAEASVYPVGSSLFGQISSETDEDYYAFDLNPGVFKVLFKPGYNLAAIVNEAGLVLAAKKRHGYTTTYMSLTVRINTPGRYYVLMTSSDTYSYSDGDYEFIPEVSTDEQLFQSLESEANNTMADASVYPVGLSLFGQISNREDKDYYAFELTPGLFKAQVKPVASEYGYYRLTIMNEAGAVLVARDVHVHGYATITFPTLTARVNTSGIYYVVMSGSNTNYYSDGDYELVTQVSADDQLFRSLESEPNDTAAAASVHQVGSSLFGQLSSREDQDYYAFDLSTGVFKVQVKPVEEYVRYRIMIVNEAGAVLAARDIYVYATNYPTLYARIDTAGTYYVVVTGADAFSYSDGDYELVAQVSSDDQLFRSLESEPNDNMAIATAYPVGSNISGQISSATDQDYYAFDLSVGVFKVEAEPVDGGYGNNRLSIVNNDGVVLAAKDDLDYFSNYSNTLTVRINSPGRYYVLKSSRNNGSYSDEIYVLHPQFIVDENLFNSLESEPNDTASEAISYPVGATILGRISTAEDGDYYAFNLTPGLINAQILPPDGDFYVSYRLEIVDSAGVILAAKTVYGYSSTYDLTLTARINVSGTYYVMVMGHGSPYMDYELITEVSIDQEHFLSRESEPNDTPIAANAYAVGVTVVGQLSSAGDKDYYAFNLTPGLLKARINPVPVALDSCLLRVTIVNSADVVLAARVYSPYYTDSLPLIARINTPDTYHVVITNISPNTSCQKDYELATQFDESEDQTRTRESELNNNFSEANLYVVGSSILGQLSSNADKDFYAFDLPAGVFKIQARQIEGNSVNNQLLFMDVAEHILAAKLIQNNNDGYTILTVKINDPGRYYVLVKGRTIDTYIDEDYEIVTLVSEDEQLFKSLESELNDSMSEANHSMTETRLLGQLSSVEDKDYFAFELNSGVFMVQVKPVEIGYGTNRVVIVNESGMLLAAKYIYAYDTAYTTLAVRVKTAGIYYVVMGGDGYYYFDQDYELLTQFSADESLFNSVENEPNDTMAAAISYRVGSSIYGNLSGESDLDYYMLNLSLGVLKLKISPGEGGYIYLRLTVIDETGNVLAMNDLSANTGTMGEFPVTINSKGRYYVSVSSVPGFYSSNNDYHLFFEFDPDTDRDGIVNSLDLDDDGDGMSDDDEITIGRNPLINEPAAVFMILNQNDE